MNTTVRSWQAGPVVTALAVSARLVVAGLLLFGPWTDEPAELAGWDAERFQQIVDDDRRPWAEHPVEYPPGSVVVLETLAGDDVVATNRALVVVGLLADLAAAALLWRMADGRAARRYLVIGLALVPMGLLRLDGVVTAVAVAAGAVLLGRRRAARAEGSFAILVAVGAMIKIWPALLVAAAWAVHRRAAAVAAVALSAAVGVGWLVWVGGGLGPIDQVFSLRGATGWHVESLPGSLIGLLGDEAPRFELNAYRIGTIDAAMTTAGRVVAVAVIVGLVALSLQRPGGDPGDPITGDQTRDGDAIERLGLVMLGSVAALLVTAPLLSPQFIVWLVPWVALAAHGRRATDQIVALGAAAAVLTGATLALFGPPALADTAPAALLVIRNLVLVAIPISCGRRLRRMPAAARSPHPRSGTS